MQTRGARLLVSTVLGMCILVGVFALFGTWDGEPQTVHAQGGTGTVRVAPNGGDAPGCGSVATPCRTVQYAVDQAAGGDKILVAAGVYTGVSRRDNVLGSAAMTQVVFISKTITLRGGYATGSWSVSDPTANPTILDAESLGRVVVISGTASPTLENLQIRGGNAPEAGPNEHCCGGVVLVGSAATISNCRIYSNTAEAAGGIGLARSPATLTGNTISTNTATIEYGGGVAVWMSDGVVIRSNSFFGNRAQKGGGGLDIYESDGTVSGNTVWDNYALTENGGGLHVSDGSDGTVSGNVVHSNHASASGGGIVVFSNTATVENNLVYSNMAGERGGGVALMGSRAALISNTLRDNAAAQDGGGLCVDYSKSQLQANSVLNNTAGGNGGGIAIASENDAILVNNVVAHNRISVTVNAWGSGIFIHDSAVELLHNTIADNSGGEENEGVHLTGEGALVSTARFTNTIIAGQDAALVLYTGNTAIVNGALWFEVIDVSRGAPGHTIVVSNDYVGDPRFANRAAGDYHIGAGSAALDRGVPSGVTTDRDGKPRPVGAGPDLGAYEYQSSQRPLYLPVVRKQ